MNYSKIWDQIWTLIFCIATIFLVVFFLITAAKILSTAQANNFNVDRKITVTDCKNNEIIFQTSGKMAVKFDCISNELEIIVKDGPSKFHRHTVFINDWVTYVVEDLSGSEI